MRRSPAYLRNLAITALIMAVVFALGTQRFPANAQTAVASIVQLPPIPTVNAGQVATVTMRLTNNASTDTTFTISISTLPTGWRSTNPGDIIAPIGGFADFTIQFSVPAGQTGGTFSDITVTAAASGTSPSAFVTVTVNGPTATPTPTITNTPVTPTTVGPTATPGPPCPEPASREPGGDQASARLLQVNLPEIHGLCELGDEDWFVFGGIGGKVYTIDITAMDPGLDLVLYLYDDQGNLQANNDDFFNRTPTPPNPFDIKPRILSWTAPRDGLYFIRVRDASGIAGNNHAYTIVINAESYGPTPITIPEICRDLFEEDGLPEQAVLITSNENHYTKRLCPTGDADWVKFFGKVGKTYYMYTDTRPYVNNPNINKDTEAGADTVIYLADRDGVSILDFNDDIAGGDTLDSEIRFTPSADGFYFLQVKNIGDIGNQFIRYDLIFKLCVPGDECGRGPVAVAPGGNGGNGGSGDNGGTGGTGSTTPAATMTGTATPTATPSDTPEPTEDNSAFLQSDIAAGAMVNGPLQGFADPSFESVWQRNDQPVAGQRATRSWVWGPRGLMARTEGYIQSASGLRQVQYFDKARMEVNNPLGDRSSRWFVTTGLLVSELISGKTQIGDNEFVQNGPADIPIAGDQGDPDAPTYASFGGVTSEPSPERTGQIPAETINRAGQVGSYSGPQRPETRLVHFVPETGHNIPQVFWDYLNARGPTFQGGRYRDDTLLEWVFTLGYPISDPYWTRISVGGVERDVLVQAFQRRVLTYSPDNPAGWQVEMGNVGRHYYLWRYGENLPAP